MLKARSVVGYVGMHCDEWFRLLASVREAAPEVPVLVLTGDTREETEFAAAAHGMDDYLVKDQVSGAQLVRAVRTVIGARNLQKRQSAMADRLMLRLHWEAGVQ